MKKRLLSILAMAFVALGMQAQDYTSKYLKNADFSADAPVREGICTYAKDVAANGTTLSGMQPVTDWVASNPVAAGVDIDAKASGIFELGIQFLADVTGRDEDAATEIFLGGKGNYAPIPTDGKTEGNVLGMVACWGAKMSYTQDVTLEAGTYTVEYTLWNTGGTTAVSANNFGFIADNGTRYVCSEKTWEVGQWITMHVNFTLTEATSGKISVGYDSANKGSGDNPKLFVASVSIKDGDAGMAAELKETLASLIEQAEDLSIDVTAYEAILNNDSATSAQVQAAIDELKNKIENAMTDFTDYFINNAHFLLGTPLDNGVCTYAKDKGDNDTPYAGMQPVQDWISSDGKTDVDGKAAGLFPVGGGETTWLGSKDAGYIPPTAKANGATEGNVFGFVSCWTYNAYYYQEVTLPAGTYTISIPMYNSTGGTDAIAKNMCGFIAEDGTEYLAETLTFPVNKWVTETIKFKLEEETSGKICIGYQAANIGSAKQPHLFVDEFLLKFNGKTDIDPSLLALNGAIRTGQSLLDNDEPCEAALIEALEDAIEAGNALKDAGSSDQTANTAAATTINNAVAAVRASIAVYKKFHDFIYGKLSETIDKYIEGDLEDFATELAEDKDKYISAWEDGEYTTEQINEIIDGFDARLAAAIKTAFEAAVENGGAANLDITCLFSADKNLGYANSNVDGWKNETGTSAFLSRVQTAEVWNQASFNVYQTLDSLPAGVYEIQAAGFYRTAANVDNYEAWQNEAVGGSAYIYAGNNRTLMHNVAELASADNTHRSAAAVEGELYVPNSNDDAHYFFYDQDEIDMTNSVKGVLAETGTLTIGVKGENLDGNAWVVWGGFTVIYRGTEGMEAALFEEVNALSAEASALADELGGLVADADDKLNEAIDAAAGCDETSSLDELKDAINALNEALAYGNESKKLMDELQKQFDFFSELAGNVESDDDVYPGLLDEVDAAISDGYESNEQIAGLIDSLVGGWAAYVQHDALDATEDEPADITAAILNSGFEGALNDQSEQSGAGNGDYWTKTREGGNDFGYQFGVFESYNTNSFDIHQTLKGLAAGYYKVTVQGFYRAGSNQDNANAFSGDSLTSFVYFYANAYEKKLNNQLENGTNGEIGGAGDEPSINYNGSEEYHVPNNREALAEQFSIGLYMNELVCKVAEGEDLTIGLKKATHVGGDWCPFDNFKLYYLGTSVSEEPVTAIESVDATNGAKIVIFDLAGRRVAKAVKGIYIINGKKVGK